jgi:hypothetical protein
MSVSPIERPVRALRLADMGRVQPDCFAIAASASRIGCTGWKPDGGAWGPGRTDCRSGESPPAFETIGHWHQRLGPLE